MKDICFWPYCQFPNTPYYFTSFLPNLQPLFCRKGFFLNFENLRNRFGAYSCASEFPDIADNEIMLEKNVGIVCAYHLFFLSNTIVVE